MKKPWLIALLGWHALIALGNVPRTEKVLPLAVCTGTGSSAKLLRFYDPITSRDGTGRILGTSSTMLGQTQLTETLSWTGDGLPATHTLARSDFTNNAAYFYAESCSASRYSLKKGFYFLRLK